MKFSTCVFKTAEPDSHFVEIRTAKQRRQKATAEGGLAMKKATLGNGVKILQLISQKETPGDQVQRVVESGLLSDILDANLASVDRDMVRQALGLNPIGIRATITSYPMSINYDRSVEDGIKAGNYDWKNDDITSEHFPSQETGTKEATVELFHYGKDMDTDEILTDLDKQGYREATLKELLALGEKYPNLQREFPIIALGSIWQLRDGYRYCSYLFRRSSKRYLHLNWIGDRWYAHCRFAAVRKYFFGILESKIF